MAETSPTKSPFPPADPYLEQNVQKMAVVMKSEAADAAAQQMVGWTIVNRMRRRCTALVASVLGHDYATNQPATPQTLDLARKILTGELPDISQGATSFYTPAIMPKEGESTQGFDVGNELETVPGFMGKNRLPARNYKPRWSKGAVRIYTPSIPEREMKFFKVNGL